MPRKQPLFRRLTTATRWPVGVTLTSWRYMWRTTPLYRSEEDGTWEEDAPPKLPDAVSDADVQRTRDGAGDLWLYPGNGAGGWLNRVKIGFGWNTRSAIF